MVSTLITYSKLSCLAMQRTEQRRCWQFNCTPLGATRIMKFYSVMVEAMGCDKVFEEELKKTTSHKQTKYTVQHDSFQHGGLMSRNSVLHVPVGRCISFVTKKNTTGCIRIQHVPLFSTLQFWGSHSSGKLLFPFISPHLSCGLTEIYQQFGGGIWSLHHPGHCSTLKMTMSSPAMFVNFTYITMSHIGPSGPEGSRKLRFPDFITTAQDGGKVFSLTHRPPLPPRNAPGTHLC